MELLTIGNRTIPVTWIVILVSFMLMYGMTRILLNKTTAENLFNGFLIMVVTWKLSIILFQFSFVVEQPLSILYFDGGIKGFLLGVVLASLYLLKLKISTNDFLCPWVLLLGSYVPLHVILTGHTVLGGISLLLNIASLYVFMKKKEESLFIIQFAILFTLLQIFFQSLVGKGMSISVLVFLWFIGIGLVINRLRRETTYE